MPAIPSCPHTTLTRRYIGEDRQQGRFADVSVISCPACGTHWLHYAWAVEGFRESGRWYEGQISADVSHGVRADQAAAILEALPSYQAGGSFFKGKILRRSGPLA